MKKETLTIRESLDRLVRILEADHNPKGLKNTRPDVLEASKESLKEPLSKAKNDKIIFDMCMKTRHDYGLRLTGAQRYKCPPLSGMTLSEARALEDNMQELLDVVLEHLK